MVVTSDVFPVSMCIIIILLGYNIIKVCKISPKTYLCEPKGWQGITSIVPISGVNVPLFTNISKVPPNAVTVLVWFPTLCKTKMN